MLCRILFCANKIALPNKIFEIKWVPGSNASKMINALTRISLAITFGSKNPNAIIPYRIPVSSCSANVIARNES